MADVLDRTINKALKTLRARKVLTIEELAALLQRSLPTARRRLKAWNTLTSYNKNGRYYALPDVPRFDSHGLWRYRDIGFSRYGNLTETLIVLVRNAQAGLSKTFQAMLADTPLVKNLQNDSYMKILLDGKPTLEARFAEVDTQAVRKQLNDSQESLEKIPATIMKIISKRDFPDIIADIFRNTRPAAMA